MNNEKHIWGPAGVNLTVRVILKGRKSDIFAVGFEHVQRWECEHSQEMDHMELLGYRKDGIHEEGTHFLKFF